jgi:hypothetical protein
MASIGSLVSQSNRTSGVIKAPTMPNNPYMQGQLPNNNVNILKQAQSQAKAKAATPNTGVATPPVQQTQQTPMQQAPAFDQQAYLNQMTGQVNGIYDQLQQSRLAQLKASRDKAMGQINQQMAELTPQYANMRNQSDVVSQQNVDRLKELMASNGLNDSGENVSGMVGLQSARQNALNGLNLQEQQQRDDYNRRITDLNDPAEEQAIIAELQAQRAQALMDAGYRADDIGYSRGRDALNDKRYDSETAYNHNRDTVGDQQWQKTFDNNNYWKQQDQNNWNTDFKYRQSRDVVGDQQWKDTFNSNEKWKQQDQNNWKSTYDYNKSQDALMNAWKQKEWAGMSPADREKAKLQQAYELALINARSKGGNGGGGGGKTKTNPYGVQHMPPTTSNTIAPPAAAIKALQAQQPGNNLFLGHPTSGSTADILRRAQNEDPPSAKIIQQILASKQKKKTKK